MFNAGMRALFSTEEAGMKALFGTEQEQLTGGSGFGRRSDEEPRRPKFLPPNTQRETDWTKAAPLIKDNSDEEKDDEEEEAKLKKKKKTTKTCRSQKPKPKKKENRRGSSSSNNSDDGDDDGVSDTDIVKSILGVMAKDMCEKLALVPGGALTPQSMEFMQDAAKEIIQRQCELLSDLTVEQHKEICHWLVSEVDKLNSKFEADLDFESFSTDLGELMEIRVDSLNEVQAKSQAWKEELRAKKAKGSTAKTHMQAKRAQPQPAGPQRQAFGAG